MGPGAKGVLVRQIGPTTPAAKLLKPDDVILRFDGVQLACDGTVPFRYQGGYFYGFGFRFLFRVLWKGFHVQGIATLHIAA